MKLNIEKVQDDPQRAFLFTSGCGVGLFMIFMFDLWIVKILGVGVLVFAAYMIKKGFVDP